MSLKFPANIFVLFEESIDSFKQLTILPSAKAYRSWLAEIDYGGQRDAKHSLSPSGIEIRMLLELFINTVQSKGC